MKKVRYAIGATAMLAPAALGLAPVAAHAATTSNAQASGKAKTVSLDHYGTARAPLAGCTAYSEILTPVGSLITELSIYNTPTSNGRSVCIGTMEVSRYFKNNNCVWIRFTVKYGNGGTSTRYLSDRCGNAKSTKRFESGFHEYYPAKTGKSYVSACVSSKYTAQFCSRVPV